MDVYPEDEYIVKLENDINNGGMDDDHQIVPGQFDHEDNNSQPEPGLFLF